jgi:hypothetical protein
MQYRLGGLVTAVLVGIGAGNGWGQGVEQAKQAVPGPVSQAAPWKYDDAYWQLRFYPHDPYLQYVVLQLGLRAGRIDEAAEAVRRLSPTLDPSRERSQNVDLFSLFSGALAVQESLQLDAMIDPDSVLPRAVPMPVLAPPPAPGQPAAKIPVPVDQHVPADSGESVSIESLQGPTVRSHPWTDMLAGRKPAMSPLAKCVPQDYYYVQFRSVNKMLGLLEQGDVWGTHLFSQTVRKAYRHDVRERVMQQLAIETSEVLRPFYDLAIQETAIVGSDPFVTEGSDVTLLFRLLQPAAFKTQMDTFLANAEKNTPGTRREQGAYRGISFVHLSSPDRKVHVYSAYPQKDLHVRSNSQVAFERVLDVIAAADRSDTPALGDTDEFAYISTLLPYGADEEDGLVYLSDPFIRRLIGPQLKLTESRRRRCHNHLRMLGHACALYRTEHGRPPASLDELATAQCVPGLFNEGKFVCPCGGQYSLAAVGQGGVCSHHGSDHALRPCCEIPIKEVSSQEAEAYQQFVQEYSQYWRTYFDPIALRIQVTDKRYRLETIVLPLIDNTLYSFLSEALGGEPQSLDLAPVPDRTIFSLGVKLDKTRLLQQMNWRPAEAVVEGPAPFENPMELRNNLMQIALAMHNYHDAFGAFPTAARYDAKKTKPLLSWRVSLLPYLEQQALYDKFHLDEPWDSPHNKALIEQMPAIYRSPGRPGMKAGTTCYVLPTGEQAIFSGTDVATALHSVTDGTSNTVMVMHTTEKRAVVWTKPDDYVLDAKTLRDALFVKPVGEALVSFADGSVRGLPGTRDDAALLALFTSRGGEEVQYVGEPTLTNQPSTFWFSELSRLGIQERDLYDFVTKGLSDKIVLHTYDADLFFDFRLIGFLGQMMGTFSGRQGFGMEGQLLPFAFLGASLNSPVYVSIPLDDPQIADTFLGKLDSTLAVIARTADEPGFFPLEQDFYQLPLAGDVSARSYGLQVGPIKWRVFWARIGDALYVSSKPYVLEDLAAKLAAGGGAEQTANVSDLKSHAMIRLRPDHWKEVLPTYRLGWAEQHRQSCLENVGRLSSAARLMDAETADQGASDKSMSLEDVASQLYGLHFFCPEGGQYVRDGLGVRCTHHGTALDPHQAAVPQDNAAIDAMLREFTGLTVTLTFLEDGLHAVLVIDR